MGFQEAKVGEMTFWAEGTAEAKHEGRVLFRDAGSVMQLEQKGHFAEQSPWKQVKRLFFGSHSNMEVDLLCKERGITGLGFQEDLCGVRVGGLEAGRDWS